MSEKRVEIIGDYVDPKRVDFEGALSFSIRSTYIEKRKLWKSKDLTAEFLGDFWKTILDLEPIKATLHFVCAELLENAVNHSIKSDYIIMIKLCFKRNELLVYVKNSQQTDKIADFKKFTRSLLAADDLQELFVLRIKAARRYGCKKSQVGLITIIKDRGATLSWKFKQHSDITRITTLARIALKGGVK
jgi:hypothetical protein